MLKFNRKILKSLTYKLEQDPRDAMAKPCIGCKTAFARQSDSICQTHQPRCLKHKFRQ